MSGSAQLAHCDHFMPSGLPAPALMTTAEVCEFLGVTESTLMSWRARKQIRQWTRGVDRPWRLRDVLQLVDRKQSERESNEN